VDQYIPAQPTGFVSDFAGVIDAASSAHMTDLLERLRGTTHSEIAVVTLPTIGDRDEAEVALAIGRKWGVGFAGEIGDTARNRGIVVLLVPRQNGQAGTGHIRIEVAGGLEGIVTDAMAGRIRDDVMGPFLAREQYGPGLAAGVEALASLIARASGVTDSTLTAFDPRQLGGSGSDPGSFIRYLPLILFILFVFVIPMLSRGGRGRRRRGI
jgi:uncharacterized protein